MFKKLKSLKSKIKKKVSKGINTKNLKKNIKSKYVPTLKSGAKKAFELGKKGAKAAYAEMERRHKENLAKYFIHIKEVNFLSQNIPKNSFEAFVKVRSRKTLISAFIKKFSDKCKTATVELKEPEFGIAPGQACVFYNNKKKMIGGGWIYSGEKII